jgi:ATP-dependent DNA helicase DinG
VLPEHDAVVFDEAHRLEDAAASWFGGRVSIAGLRRLSRDVERTAREKGETAPARLLDEIERAGAEVMDAVHPERGRRRLGPADVDAALDLVVGLTAALGALSDALAAGGDEADLLARRALTMAADLDASFELDADHVSWAEQGAISWAPVDVAGVLREALWGGDVTGILVSATLQVSPARDDGDSPGSLAFVRRRLGLDEARELIVASPFDYREQALVYVPSRLPEQRARDYYERLAAEVIGLCTASRGRALVLTTSYRSLEELASRVAPALPYPVLAQGEAPRERLLERFRAGWTRS